MDIAKQISERVESLSQTPQILVPQTGERSTSALDAIENYENALKESIAADRELWQILQQKKVKQNIIDWRTRVGERWNTARLEEFSDQPEIVGLLKDRIERFERKSGMNQTSVLVSGRLGRGKTYLAYAYAYELIRRGLLLPNQVYTSTEQSLADIAFGGYKRHDMLKDLLNPKYRFYIFDDVGRATYPDDPSRGQIWYDVINHIYSERLTVVITTNLVGQAKSSDDATVRRWIGEAAASRLLHIVGTAGFLEMSGQDKRSELAKQWENQHRGR